jgi:MFS family permease
VTATVSAPVPSMGPVYMMGLGHGATHWIVGILYIVLPLARDELGLSYTDVGLLISTLHASSFAANFGSGALVDLTGRRVLLQVVSLAVGAAALLVFGFTGVYALLLLMVGLIGATNNLWHPPAIAFISAQYPERRGYALSIHATGASIGDMVAPAAAGVILATYGWRETTMLSTIPVFAVTVLFMVALLPRDKLSARTVAQSGGINDYLRGIGRMARERSTAGLCLLAAFRSAAQNGLLLFLPLFLVDTLSASPAVMGGALMTMHLAGAIIAPIAGSASDRVGRRPVVMAGLAGSTIVIVLLTLAADTNTFIVGVAVLGFALYAVRPVIHGWIMDITPDTMRGSATSLLFGTQSLFSVAIPTLGGWIADQHGLTAVFYMVAALMLIANLICIALPDSSAAKTA